MGRPEISSAVHPEDEQLVAQLAALQNMHDQVSSPASFVVVIISKFDDRSITYALYLKLL